MKSKRYTRYGYKKYKEIVEYDCRAPVLLSVGLWEITTFACARVLLLERCVREEAVHVSFILWNIR